MSARRVTGTVCCAALCVAVLLGACKGDESKQDKSVASAAASQIAATTAGGDSAAPAVSSVAANADAAPPPGGCTRLEPGTHEPMCNLAKDYCCENVASGEGKCAPHAEAKGIQCSDDGAWRVAIGCSTSSMCGPAQKCCVQEPVPGFLQTVCAASCQHEEACLPDLPGGACKDPNKFDCVAATATRTGGRCVAKGATNTAASMKIGDECQFGDDCDSMGTMAFCDNMISPGHCEIACKTDCDCPSDRHCGPSSHVNPGLGVCSPAPPARTHGCAERTHRAPR